MSIDKLNNNRIVIGIISFRKIFKIKVIFKVDLIVVNIKIIGIINLGIIKLSWVIYWVNFYGFIILKILVNRKIIFIVFDFIEVKINNVILVINFKLLFFDSFL